MSNRRPARRPAPRQRDANDPKRILPVVALVVIVVVAGGIALLAGGDGDGTGGGDGDGLVYAEVDVGGSGLPQLGEGEDPAVGQEAPTLEGSAPDGTPVTVDFGQPTLLVFLAHWCPHCQAELPRLVQLAEEGAFEGIETVAVLTGTDPSAPNFPADAWLEREGWTGEVLVDEEDREAASAFGLSFFPFLVLVDGEGQVVARHAGEQGLEGLREFVQQVG